MLAEDPTIFDYDAHYDADKEKKAGPGDKLSSTEGHRIRVLPLRGGCR